MKKKDFDTFLLEVGYWVGKFGLSDYEIRVTTTKDEGVRGTCTTYSNNEDRIADICVQDDWKNPDHKDLCRVAFHEVCELLIRELFNIGAIFVHGSVMRTELHRIIRRLENSYFVEDYGRRIKRGVKFYGDKTSAEISSSRTQGSKAALIPVDIESGDTRRHASD
jgi:hypothetical protein